MSVIAGTGPGWIVERRTTIAKTGREHVGYWYGPRSGFGTTTGPLTTGGGLSPSLARFRTRADAETALREVFGGRWRGDGYRPVRVTPAMLTGAGQDGTG